MTDEYTAYTDPDYQPTEVEQTAIEKALSRLSGWVRDEYAQAAVAASALRILVAATLPPEPDDLPLFAAAPYPTWNQPSGMLPVVTRPLLDLLEDVS